MQKDKRYQRLILILVAALPFSTMAQERGSSSEGASSLEEIIVTARFREESVQDIGAAVTGVSGADLEARGIVNFDDLAQTVVGLSNVRTRQNSNQVSIRGVTNDLGFLFSSSNVFSFYVDDVAVTSTTTQRDFGVTDINRIEVVRGPQPTLFGEGAVGGVIRYFTVDPDLDSEGLTGTARGSYENIQSGGSAYRADAAVSAALVPGKFAARLSAFQMDDDGFVDNRLSGEKDANSFNSKGGRLVLLGQPTDNLELRFSAFFARDEFKLDNQIEVGTPIEDLTYGLAGFPDGLFPDFVGSGTDEFDLYSGRLTYSFGDLELTSITGYYTRNTVANALSIGNTLGLAPFFPTIDTTTFGSVKIGADMFSQELRLISRYEGPMNFTAGFYYRDKEQKVSEDLVMPGLVSVATPSTEELLHTLDINNSEQYSAFAEITYDLSEKLRLVAGVRYVFDTYSANLAENEVVNFIPANAPWTEANPIDFAFPTAILDQLGVSSPYEFELKEALPHVGLEFSVNDNLLLYGNVAKGVRNGGTGQAIAALATAGDPNDPNFAQNFADQLFFGDDSVVSFDAGMKSLWMDGRFLANVGVFFTEYKDTQISVAAPANNATNGPDQSLSGLELETQYLWTDNLSTYFNATVLDTEFKEDFTVVLGAGIDIEKGDHAVNAPDLSAALGVNYSRPIGNGNWSLASNTSFQFIGKRYATNQNFPISRLDPIENLNFRIGIENERVAITAYVSNALNDIEAVAKGAGSLSATRDANGVALDAPLNSLSVNRPRAFGLSVRVDF